MKKTKYLTLFLGLGIFMSLNASLFADEGSGLGGGGGLGSVPEPSTWALLAAGGLGLWAFRRRS